MRTRLDSTFFSLPLRSSLYFWMCSIGVLTAIIEALLIEMRFGTRIGKPSTVWMGLAILGLLSLWIEIRRLHRTIHALYQRDETAAPNPGAANDIVLVVAAKAACIGLAVASCSVVAVLLSMSKALRTLTLT